MGLRRQAVKEKIVLKLIRNPSEQELLDLYQVEINAHVSPWSYDGLKDCFTDNTYCIALYLKQELVGFAFICLLFDEAELYTIGIKNKYQGLGLGHHLLLASLQLSSALGAKQCFLEVRVSNERALYLYDLLGFTITGTRKDYYPATSTTPKESAYTMVCDLSKVLEQDIINIAPQSKATKLQVQIEFQDILNKA